VTAEPMTIRPEDRRSPLHAHGERLAAGSSEGVVVLREVPFLAQIGLRLPEDAVDAMRACAAAIGVELPRRPGVATGSAQRSVLWLGPDEWLVVGEPGGETELVTALSGAVAGTHASVVDLSSNRTVLDLAGPRSRAVLEAGCRIDLHPRAFGPGGCVATEFARTAIYLHQLDDARYRLFVRPSFAVYLAEWLLDAMVEHTAPVRTG
jgi:sarcosine oxidase subunit gamma